VIIENVGKSATELSGTRGGVVSRRRGGNVPDRPGENAPHPPRPANAIPIDALSETGQPPARKKKADCGELFRSWAFPNN
jgi:hypothetical protein